MEHVKMWFDGSVKNDSTKWVAAYSVVAKADSGETKLRVVGEVCDGSRRRSSTYAEYAGLLSAVQLVKKHRFQNVTLITDFNSTPSQLEGKTHVDTTRKDAIALVLQKTRNLIAKMKFEGVNFEFGLCGELENPAHFLAYAYTDKLARRDGLVLPDNPAAERFRKMMLEGQRKLL